MHRSLATRLATSTSRSRLPISITGIRTATSYTKILDKVFGYDVHKVKKITPLEQLDSMYAKPQSLPTQHNTEICRVTFGSFQLHRLDFYMDFCRKAAYHMGIPCAGAVALPKVLRRWTVLKSPFVHKSAMEVFERRTHKRLLVLRDADPEVVKKWIKYVNDNIPVGIGMRYTMTEYEPLNVGEQIEHAIKTGDSQKVDSGELNKAKYAKELVTRGRRVAWTTYKDLPVYTKDDIKALAMNIADKLKEQPTGDIEKLTKEVVEGSKAPKPTRSKKKIQATEPKEPKVNE